VWKLGGQFVANIDDIRPQFRSGGNTYLSQSAIYQSTLVRGAPGLSGAGASINATNGAPMTLGRRHEAARQTWYSDQILPFDITLAGASNRDEDLRRRDPERRARRHHRRQSDQDASYIRGTTRCFATKMIFFFSRGRGGGRSRI